MPMNSQDRSAIEGLFQRLQQAETQSGPRDAEAEALIDQLVQRQSGAAYVMAQVILVQEHALRHLQTQVEELEKERAARPQSGGGFLGGLFGAPSQSPPPAAARGGWGTGSRAPQPGAAPFPQGSSGGFLSGALQTAMGVAGGVLLGNAIAGLFADPAAAETPAAETPAAEPEAAEPEAGPEDDGSGFFDGFGGGDDEEF